MGCHIPSTCLNSKADEIIIPNTYCDKNMATNPQETIFIEKPQVISEDKISHVSIDKNINKATINSNGHIYFNEDHTNYSHNNHDSKSISSSIQSSSEKSHCSENFNYREHAESMFHVINDMRFKPQKYLNKLNKFVKKYNKTTKTFDLLDSDHLTITMKSDIDPQYVIEFLEKTPSIGPILWSERDFIRIYEENELNKFNSPSDDEIVFTKPKCVKIESDFILHSPEYNLFMIILQDFNNIKKVFSENIEEGVVICFKVTKKTMIYLVEN